MEENNIYETEVNVESSVEEKPKKDLTNIVGAGAIGVGAVVLFEGLRFGVKKAKKGIVKLANKIETERKSEEADSNEPAEKVDDSEK